jgi:hypothetical protein
VVRLEHSLRFPWSGGRHPWLDAVIETPTHLIGVESKRFEPYRAHKAATFSAAFWRRVWGERMTRFEAMRDRLSDGSVFDRLDAAQLVKHAFGLVSEVERRAAPLKAVLVYLYADPAHWPSGREVDPAAKATHGASLARFADAVRGDAVDFVVLTYRQLLDSWGRSGDDAVAGHADAVRRHFGL